MNQWQAIPCPQEGIWPIQNQERRSVSVMPGPGPRSPIRPGGRGAAEVFMATSTQGGGKTNSEKIMDALSG
jgi:hypothetical protein